MTTLTTYTLDKMETEIDMNSLFTLTYNFDLLKSVLVSIVQSQKATNQKLLDLDEKFKEKDQKIQDLQNDLIILQTREKHREELEKEKKIKEEEDVTESIEIIDDKDKIATKRNSINELNENATLQMTNDPNLNKVIKKVNYLDFQIKGLMSLNTEVSDIRRKLREHDDSIVDHQVSIDELKKITEALQAKQTEFENNFQEINFKLINVDALNMFKKDNDENTNYGTDELTVMVFTLEKKLNTKIAYIDERFKKNEDELLKLRQLEKSLEETNRDLQQTNKNFDWVKEQLTIIFARLDDAKKYAKTLNENTNNAFKEEDRKIKQFYDDKFIEINNIIQNLIESSKGESNSNIVPTNIDDGKVKELQRRVTELEKNLKNLSSSINIDIINKEFLRLNDLLNSKANNGDLQDLRDAIGKSNIYLGEINITINLMKDSVTQLQEDRKIIDEISWIRKRVESLSSTIMNLKTNEDFSNTSTNKVVSNENAKYVELSTFNEFKKDTLKEFDNINLAITEIKSLIEEILSSLKTKLTERDLRNLEDFLLLKVEELKNGCQKKFADKNETAKNLKYLDGQIKHIIDLYMKKMEKGDNWLLAKKPIGGYSCASCEAYIGDLHENMQYIPWNKYPIRDPNDKLYRIGNGFSKMLQMINIDQTNRPKNTQTSTDFYKNHENPPEKKEVHLPRVKSNINPNVNMSADDITDANNEADIVDDLQPKIVKIYKKSKEKKIE